MSKPILELPKRLNKRMYYDSKTCFCAVGFLAHKLCGYTKEELKDISIDHEKMFRKICKKTGLKYSNVLGDINQVSKLWHINDFSCYKKDYGNSRKERIKNYLNFLPNFKYKVV